ncbi:MAG: hypothetical protein AB1724_02745 [Thermodesulfobacteriota bacterium]
MPSFIEFIVGLIFAIFLGFLIEPILRCCVPKPAKPKDLDIKIWDSLAKPFQGGQVIGFFERILFLIAFWLHLKSQSQAISIIAVWLAFKIASKWEVWKNIIKLPENLESTSSLLLFDARNQIGHSLFNRFLLGTLLNLLIGATAAYIGLHFSEFSSLLFSGGKMTISTNCTKDWVDVLTALITPTIAIVGITIAALQWKLSKNRYKHELFDKRWAQFVAIRDFMGKIRAHGVASQDDEHNFLIETRGCRFLFGNEIQNLVDETYKKSGLLNDLEKELKSITVQEDRKRNVAHQREIKDWVESQIKELETRFGKYLQL